MGTESKKEGTDVILSLKERFCFSLGDFGYQCVFYWVGAYLMIFYTDVFLIPAAAVSVLMLVVRLYDAINDPILGSVMDRTNSSRGRYRPWIAVGGIGLAITAILMFWAHPGWEENSKIIYMYVTYMLVVTFSTMFYMAYMALNGCMTSNSMERAKASSWRMVMSYVAMLLVGYAAPYMLDFFENGVGSSGSSVNAYVVSIAICAVISVPLILLVCKGTTERIRRPANEQKTPMKQQWRALLRNPSMMILLFCMVVHGVQMNGRMSVATYYCVYVGSGTALLATYNLLNSFGCIVGSAVGPVFYRLTGNKGRAASFVMMDCAASMIGQYFTVAGSAAFFVLTLLTGFCYGSFSTLMFSMIPDAVDYADAEYGVRADGFLNAIGSFGFKVGGAVATSCIGVALAASGYVANAVQNEACLMTIRVMMTICPGVMCALAAIFLLRYKLDQKMQEEIIEKVMSRGTEP